jgi:VanZ family protein
LFLKYNIPAFIWAVIILIIMAYPGDKLPELSFWQFIPFFDKWVHFGLFFIFAGLLGFGFIKQARFPKLNSNTILLVFVISAIYGGATELMQNLVSSRTADYFDFFSDVAGSLIGATLIKIILDKVKNKKFQKTR